MFGWSYPPGCNSVPGDEPTPPCSLCGKDAELEPEKGGCSCEPCKVCGQGGCLTHLDLKDLTSRMERAGYVFEGLRAEMIARYWMNPLRCTRCKGLITFEESREMVASLGHLCPICAAREAREEERTVTQALAKGQG